MARCQGEGAVLSHPPLIYADDAQLPFFIES
jgi:hypothetical protein